MRGLNYRVNAVWICPCILFLSLLCSLGYDCPYIKKGEETEWVQNCDVLQGCPGVQVVVARRRLLSSVRLRVLVFVTLGVAAKAEAFSLTYSADVYSEVTAGDRTSSSFKHGV